VNIPLESVLAVAEPFLKFVVAPALAVWVGKKIHDRDTREALAVAADAALVLAIRKSKGNGAIKDIAELVREVVAGILANPKVTNNPQVAEVAAAAAVARAGLATVQRVHMNPDGTMVPGPVHPNTL
jgi:hypothetical protein